MPRRTGSLVALLLSASTLLIQTGCYDWIAVQPTEISKLHPGSQQEVGRTGNTVVVAYSTQTLTGEDGTAKQIKGDYDLRITTKDGQTTYTHPVAVEPQPLSGYLLQGGNQPKTAVRLDEIQKAEVSQYNNTKTIVLGGVVGVVVGLIFYAVQTKLVDRSTPRALRGVARSARPLRPCASGASWRQRVASSTQPWHDQASMRLASIFLLCTLVACGSEQDEGTKLSLLNNSDAGASGASGQAGASGSPAGSGGSGAMSDAGSGGSTAAGAGMGAQAGASGQAAGSGGGGAGGQEAGQGGGGGDGPAAGQGGSGAGASGVAGAGQGGQGGSSGGSGQAGSAGKGGAAGLSGSSGQAGSGGQGGAGGKGGAAGQGGAGAAGAGGAAAGSAGASGVCPDEMTAVPEGFCVDRWEAQVEVEEDGIWKLHSPYETLDSVTGKTRAVTAPGVVPQGYISGLQARAACEGAGKRLCSRTEYRRACQGPETFTYPYGNDYQKGACNEGREVHPIVELFGTGPDVFNSKNMNDPAVNQLPDSLAATGAFAGCESVEGTFDMVGNLHEWVDEDDGTFCGGFYVDAKINGPGCLYTTTAHDISYHDYSTGFRCCLTP